MNDRISKAAWNQNYDDDDDECKTKCNHYALCIVFPLACKCEIMGKIAVNLWFCDNYQEWILNLWRNANVVYFALRLVTWHLKWRKRR